MTFLGFHYKESKGSMCVCVLKRAPDLQTTSLRKLIEDKALVLMPTLNHLQECESQCT